MKHENKMLHLSFNLYDYWKPSSWADPHTPNSWKCTIAEITHCENQIEINNFVTMEKQVIRSSHDLIKQLGLIDSLLHSKKSNIELF
tara:strand:- start:19 stop:279 length:261 start_codon:yes stop_codon:yes gene_type:complete